MPAPYRLLRRAQGEANPFAGTTMTSIFAILFAVILLIHMGISSSVQELFGKIQELHPEHKDVFSQKNAMFLNTLEKQKRVTNLCQEIDSYDSRRLASLIELDNMVLGVGVVIILVFGVINILT